MYGTSPSQHLIQPLVSNNSLELSSIDIDQINHLYDCASVSEHKTSIREFGQRLIDNFVPTYLSYQLQLLIGHQKWDIFLVKWHTRKVLTKLQ